MVNLYNNKIITTKADVWVSDMTNLRGSRTVINEKDLQETNHLKLVDLLGTGICDFNVNCWNLM